MSLTTYEMARILEQLDESPEKVMYGKLLNELGNQSSERIRSAAKQVPLTVLTRSGLPVPASDRVTQGRASRNHG
ncbi:hypothetical protein VCSRO171_2698 [Vibrio cholerae]|nr:hypothetical protein VCSRO171_2698 [Vibrio cholerae]